MSDLPGSAVEIVVDPPQDQSLRNLDIDETTAESVPVPSTPRSLHSLGVSTPALPRKIAGTEGTATPLRFAPEDREERRTVSDDTYDSIRESYLCPPQCPFFSSLFLSSRANQLRKLTQWILPTSQSPVHQEAAPPTNEPV